VELLNGAQASNVYWYVYSNSTGLPTVTLQANSNIKGIVLTYGNIIVNENVVVDGKLLSHDGRIEFSGKSVSTVTISNSDTASPTGQPSGSPSSQPSGQPSGQPSISPETTLIDQYHILLENTRAKMIDMLGITAATTVDYTGFNNTDVFVSGQEVRGGLTEWLSYRSSLEVEVITKVGAGLMINSVTSFPVPEEGINVTTYSTVSCIGSTSVSSIVTAFTTLTDADVSCEGVL